MSGLSKAVGEFIDQREEYVRVLKQCVEAGPDYHRWSGHAEARRQLANKLAQRGIDLAVAAAPQGMPCPCSDCGCEGRS